jgi:hypothetical protein
MTGELQTWIRLRAPGWAIGPVSRYGPGLEPSERPLSDDEAAQALSEAFRRAYGRAHRVSPMTVRLARQFGPQHVHHPDRRDD